MNIILFSFYGLNVYLYGIIASLAIIAGLLITKGNLYLRRDKFVRVLDILIISIPIGVVFARLVYVILHWKIYQHNWSEIFMLQHGGLSVYGAFAGFLLTVFVYTYFQHLSFWYWLDLLTPALILGLAIAQFGHFICQATVGVPVTGSALSESKIVEYIEFAFRPLGFQEYEYFRPVALYQASWQLFVFGCAILLTIWQIYYRGIQAGNIFLWSVILLGIGRFGFGFYYLTMNPNGGLHFAQILSLAVVILCGGLIAMRIFLPRHRFARQIFRS